MNYTYQIVSGLLASFISIYGLNYLYEIQPNLRQELGSYRKRIMYIPLYFIGISIIIAKILDSIFDEDAKVRRFFPYIEGAIMGLILSILGRYYWHLDEIMGISNPNMIHIYGPILFIFIYGFIIPKIRKNICN